MKSTSETREAPLGDGRRQRSPRGQGDRLRGELIDATAELLTTLSDVNQLSMRAVAAKAGVTPPSIYRHFEDKQALLVAVLEKGWAKLHETLVAAAVDDPFVSMRRMGVAYVDFGRENPGQYKVLFSAAAPAGVTEYRDEHPAGPTFTFLVEMIERCLEEGAVAPRDRNSWMIAMHLFVTGHGFVDLQISEQFPFPWPPVEAYVEWVLTDVGLVPERSDRA